VIEKAEIEGVGDIAPPPASGALSAVGETEPQVAMFLESKTVAAVICERVAARFPCALRRRC